MENAVYSDVTPRCSCKNLCFGRIYRLHRQGDVLSSLILFTLMMEMIRSSETLLLTKATWRNILADEILHSHRRENHEA
jgi:hypothetical protein